MSEALALQVVNGLAEEDMMQVRVAVMMAAATMVTLIGSSTATAAARDQGGDDDRQAGKSFTFAVIGDIPYGDAQIAAFPGRIAQLNADPQVQLVNHLGDIKSGSSVCSDEYYAARRSDFDRFADPLVYTPGDNEWTDCHRVNNGGYNPLERLAAVRADFFPTPGQTLVQHPIEVDSQNADGYPENVSYQRAQVAFAAVHIVGSNNSLVPWTGNTAPTAEQTAEVLGRTAADIQLIRDTFKQARSHRDRAVVLLTQADMFDPTITNPAFADYYAFQPIVAAIARESARFGGPVYLFNGDSHVFSQDQPLAAGSTWLSFYGVTTPAPNLARVTVEGSTGVDEWLKVTIDKHNPAVLNIEHIAFS